MPSIVCIRKGSGDGLNEDSKLVYSKMTPLAIDGLPPPLLTLVFVYALDLCKSLKAFLFVELNDNFRTYGEQKHEFS